MLIVRSGVLLIGLTLLWQIIVVMFSLPPYILPGPSLVLHAFIQNGPLIIAQTWPTLVEAILGLILGALTGAITALIMAMFKSVRFWMLPLVLVSQAIPTFAIAPLLVIWFGYGMASKIITTLLMLFFPVTSSFFDGLRRTPSGWVDLAHTMNATTWQTLWHVRVPAALPSLASGLRVATAFAPLGAIIGEWVGASRGLGFLMLNANARMQIDLMFACLIVIIAMALSLFFAVDRLLRWILPWSRELK